MRNPERIPLILTALERRWREQPDLRLGQLLTVLLRRELPDLPPEEEGRRLFNVEDTQLLQWLGPLDEEGVKFVRDEQEKPSRGWFSEPDH